MIVLIFSVSAVVLFTLGFRLVKRGKPHTRRGGDAYNKRRRLRTIGWMMWAASAVLAVLAIIEAANSLPPPAAAVAKVATVPVIHHVVATPATTSFVPNLMHAAAVLPNAPGGETNGSMVMFPDETRPAPQSFTATPIPSLLNSSIPAGTTESNGANSLAAKPVSESVPQKRPAEPWFRPIANVPVTSPEPVRPPRDSSTSDLATQRKMESEVAKLSAALEKDPTSVVSLIERGNIYGNEKKWDLATKDYRRALELKSNFGPALFNLAEVDFMQRNYDAARRGFVPLQNDNDFRDLASYNVFLCDLLGGHKDLAAKELDAFNKIGEGAPYYFSNIAWSLYHKKVDDARSLMESAVGIFAPEKVNLYFKPLVDLGYAQEMNPPE